MRSEAVGHNAVHACKKRALEPKGVCNYSSQVHPGANRRNSLIQVQRTTVEQGGPVGCRSEKSPYAYPPDSPRCREAARDT